MLVPSIRHNGETSCSQKVAKALSVEDEIYEIDCRKYQEKYKEKISTASHAGKPRDLFFLSKHAST